MTPDELKAWQAEHGVTVAQLAAALGRGERAVYRWRSGEVPIPGSVVLAIRYMEREGVGR